MCFTSEKHHQWVEWLPLAEWWYNSNYHEATKMTPYEVVYGQLPSSPISYILGCSKLQVVDQLLQNHATMLAHLKDNIHQAQNKMKQWVEQHHSKHTFQEGGQVFLCLQPYKKTSLKENGYQKLAQKFYRPYQMLQRTRAVAYKLALPPTSKILPVFHVTCLQKVVGKNCKIQTSLPELDEEGSLLLKPEQVLDTRERHLCIHTINQVLFKQKGTS